MIRGIARILIALITLVPVTVSAQSDRLDKSGMRAMSVDDYILKYSEIAKEEMRRFGIPASITMAQGILESNFGNSELAKNANNHFGIKCHNDWKGKGYYMDDDKKNECFRVYKSAEESFTDHSNFLKTRSNYSTLFLLDPKDYKSWAKGLKNCGYATNPQYANLLIHMIEEHKLADLDNQEVKAEKVTPQEVVAQYDNKVLMFNNIKTVIVQKGETIDDVARKYNINKTQLVNYNDLNEGDSLLMGSKLYLQPKRFRGNGTVHEVKKGETMRDISQKEGIKLWSLYRKNRMEWGQEAAVGENLCLQSKCANQPKLRPEEEIRQEIRNAIDARTAEQRKKFEQERADSVAKAPLVAASQPPVIEKPPVVETIAVMPKKDTDKVATTIHTIPLENVGDTMKLVNNDDDGFTMSVIVHHDEEDTIFHVVQAKETLFSISQKYYTTVDSLKKWNNLVLPISTSQRIIVAFGKVPEPNKVEMINEPTPEEPVVNEKPKTKPATTTIPAAITSTSTTSSPEYHTVKAGEGLFGIAKKYQVTTGQIKAWNNLSGDEIRPGQKLKVSAGGTKTIQAPAPTPAVVEPATPAKTSPIPTKTETKPDTNIDGGPVYHTVAQGETLYSLARTYGVTVSQIKQWNNMSDLNIKVGQKLLVKK